VRDVWILGAAMTPFGKQPERSARDLVRSAVSEALAGAGAQPRAVQAAYVGNTLEGLMTGQAMIRGQVALRDSGLMGVPVVNVENSDCSGSTAVHLGWEAVAHGIHDLVLVVGYEKFDHDDPARSYRSLTSYMDLAEVAEIFRSGDPQRAIAPALMAGASMPGEEMPVASRDALVQIAVKNHYHGSLNPLARYRTPVTADEVLAAPTVAAPLTRLMCSAIADGAAALVLGARRNLGDGTAGARIAASRLVSGRGDDMTVPPSISRAILETYEAAAIGPEDLSAVELCDTTAVFELLLYPDLRLCARDAAERMVLDRTTWLGGRLPVNPSGGFLARGNPSGASGVAQVVELAWQLEGRCGQRQVESAKTALAHCGGGWIGSDVAACTLIILSR
jgi:acetyl-CoA acetyltransferase